MHNFRFCQYKISNLDAFLFLNVFLLPVFDNISGAMFKLGIIGDGSLASPSQIGRFISLIVLVLLIDKNGTRNVKLLSVSLVMCLLLVEMFMSLFHADLMAFIFGVVYSFKVIFCFATAFLLSSAAMNNFITNRQLELWIIRYGYCVSFLVLCSYLSGFHIANYSQGIATRGLFISGNGLGVVLGIACLLRIHVLTHLKILSLLSVLFLLVSTALIGTKASLIFCIISIFFLFKKLICRAPLFTILVVVVFCIYLIIPLIDVLTLVFQNIIYKFDKIDDKWLLLASSRDQFVFDAFRLVDFSGFRALRFVFGAGGFFAYSDFSADGHSLRKFLENDLFELFFSYGIISVLLYFFIFFYGVARAVIGKNYFYLFLLVLVFLHSITVGHVVFNGTSAMMLSFVVGLACSKRRAPVTIKKGDHVVHADRCDSFV